MLCGMITSMQIPSSIQSMLSKFSEILTNPATVLHEETGCFTSSHMAKKNNPCFLSSPILDAPQMNDSTCASTLTWMDGNEETFICSAWGNPKPRVECTKDDVPYTIGVPQRITKEHDGIYHCNATNPYGSVARDVTIHVERKLA